MPKKLRGTCTVWQKLPRAPWLGSELAHPTMGSLVQERVLPLTHPSWDGEHFPWLLASFPSSVGTTDLPESKLKSFLSAGGRHLSRKLAGLPGSQGGRTGAETSKRYCASVPRWACPRVRRVCPELSTLRPCRERPLGVLSLLNSLARSRLSCSLPFVP